MNPSPLFRQQATFIPQQAPQNTGRGLYLNVFFIIGNIALFGMVLAWAGLFGYRFYLDKNINELQAKLTTSAEEALENKDGEEGQTIDDIKALDSRLIAGKKLLEGHTITEPLFKLLDEITLTNSVRFTSFKYEMSETNTFDIEMQGAAGSFSSLAYQQNVFKENPSLENIVFSDFTLDEKSGNVTFKVKFMIKPETLSFIENNKGQIPDVVNEEGTVDEESATSTIDETL